MNDEKVDLLLERLERSREHKARRVSYGEFLSFFLITNAIILFLIFQ